MPCSSEGFEKDVETRRLEELNLVTRLLCGLCRQAEAGGPVRLDAVTMGWWERHKQLDARRQAAEQTSRRNKEEHERLKREATAKLSPEERKALGLW
jgi:hypothetical protein